MKLNKRIDLRLVVVAVLGCLIGIAAGVVGDEHGMQEEMEAEQCIPQWEMKTSKSSDYFPHWYLLERCSGKVYWVDRTQAIQVRINR